MEAPGCRGFKRREQLLWRFAARGRQMQPPTMPPIRKTKPDPLVPSAVVGPSMLQHPEPLFS